MARKSIRGWTWSIFGYRLEFVTVHHIVRVIALSDKKNIKPIKRIEW